MLSPRRAARFLNKLARLSAPDRRLLGEAVWVLATVRVGLWVIAFKTIGRWTAATAPRRRSGPAITPGQISSAIQTGARLVPGASCLTQALAAEVLIRRRGHPCLLRLGVARESSGSLRAHAWLESNGVAIVGGDYADYTLLPAFEVLRK
jgi:hypothetical protein